MQIPNVTTDMGTTVGWSDTMIRNISFTQAEWIKFANLVNQSNSEALYLGLFVGAVAGFCGLFAALKFVEWRDGKN